MIRLVSAAAMAVLLVPAAAAAQTVVFTVSTATADVHKSPSVGSPVIGHASRGRELVVTREVGDWLRVSWPDAPEGTGFVRRSLGSIKQAASPASAGAATAGAASPVQPVSQPAMGVRADIAAVQRSALPSDPTPSEYVVPPSHRIGIGGLMNGSTIGFGASGRAWARRRFGVQIELSRFSLTDASTVGRVNSVVVAPSMIYSLRSHVRDAFWVRPYFGGGAKLTRSTFRMDPAAASLTENSTSWQVLGGTELTLPSAPRFAISADVRYDSSREPFAGFEFGGLGFSIGGHWYIK